MNKLTILLRWWAFRVKWWVYRRRLRKSGTTRIIAGEELEIGDMVYRADDGKCYRCQSSTRAR